MRTVTLGDTGRKTTQLGYGCSSLMGAMGRRASVETLEAAYEAGLRHFDVAPMYGYGEAESCLGEFLKRKAAAEPGVTITTKFGIEPPQHSGLLRLARRAAGPLLKAAPALKKRLTGVAGAVTAPVVATAFTAEAARRSLDRSLRALGVESIDLLLLHEARAEQLGDDGLLRFLEESVAAGKIASFGVGSERARTEELLVRRPEYCRTVQHEWSVLDGPTAGATPEQQPPSIHHRALTENFRAVAHGLREAPAVCQRWSDVVGADLDDRSVLAALMLKAALEVFPESVLLVSSKNVAHLRENVETAARDSLRVPALRLAKLAAHEGLPSRTPVEATC